MKTQKQFAMCAKLEKLFSASFNSNEIRVDICGIDEKTQTPRNFRLDYETPKTSNGGCFAKIFASDSGDGLNCNLFSWYGPELAYPDQNDYRHGLRAMERISKRMDGIYATRGNATDAAQAMGQFLEASDVEFVYVRPDGSKAESWLNRGEWEKLTIGSFIERVRRNLKVNPVTTQAEVAA